MQDKANDRREKMEQEYKKTWEKKLTDQYAKVQEVQEVFQKDFIKEIQEFHPGVFNDSGKPEKTNCKLSLKGLQRESVGAWKGRVLKLIGPSMKFTEDGVPLVTVTSETPLYGDDLVKLITRELPIDEIDVATD